MAAVLRTSVFLIGQVRADFTLVVEFLRRFDCVRESIFVDAGLPLTVLIKALVELTRLGSFGGFLLQVVKLETLTAGLMLKLL